jgi:hypothetical protein
MPSQPAEGALLDTSALRRLGDTLRQSGYRLWVPSSSDGDREHAGSVVLHAPHPDDQSHAVPCLWNDSKTHVLDLFGDISHDDDRTAGSRNTYLSGYAPAGGMLDYFQLDIVQEGLWNRNVQLDYFFSDRRSVHRPLLVKHSRPDQVGHCASGGLRVGPLARRSDGVRRCLPGAERGLAVARGAVASFGGVAPVPPGHQGSLAAPDQAPHRDLPPGTARATAMGPAMVADHARQRQRQHHRFRQGTALMRGRRKTRPLRTGRRRRCRGFWPLIGLRAAALRRPARAARKGDRDQRDGGFGRPDRAWRRSARSPSPLRCPRASARPRV